ncbi:MAG: hypothetical protein AB8G14_04210 [Ilumatobacter sp.]
MAWELFDRDVGGFQICGVDEDALVHAPIAELPVACDITVTAGSAAPAALEATERDLERVTDSLGGRLVATSRTRTTLTSLVYLTSDDGADGYSKIALPGRASISVAPAIDPEWTMFERARPVGIEEQSMLDFRMRTQLHDAGDLGGERPIEHVVNGLGADVVEAYVTAVTAGIPGLDAMTDVDHPGRALLTHRADPRDVTESSWIIRQIAERFGATYDGWGCAVLGPEPRPVSSGRRWFRRS